MPASGELLYMGKKRDDGKTSSPAEMVEEKLKQLDENFARAADANTAELKGLLARCDAYAGRVASDPEAAASLLKLVKADIDQILRLHDEKISTGANRISLIRARMFTLDRLFKKT